VIRLSEANARLASSCPECLTKSRLQGLGLANMKRVSFVIWLYVMAMASLVAAIAGKSIGWLVGSVIIFAVARLGRRKLSHELENGRQGASGRFMIWAFALLIGGMFVLYKLQTAG